MCFDFVCPSQLETSQPHEKSKKCKRTTTTNFTVPSAIEVCLKTWHKIAPKSELRWTAVCFAGCALLYMIDVLNLFSLFAAVRDDRELLVFHNYICEIPTLCTSTRCHSCRRVSLDSIASTHHWRPSHRSTHYRFKPETHDINRH